MKKSFMTRVLAVSLSAAMAFSLSSASNLMTASAASTVKLATTFKTLKVKQTYQLKLKSNTLSWKITKVTTSDKTICTVYDKKASSVMLKGKGVGRATIKVKTKTTKRKYPKNIKWMSCRVNVKAADPDTPVTPAEFKMTASAASATTVNVTFTEAVDEPVAASNFSVSGGSVTVENVALSADKKSAVLTIKGAAAETEYTLTATNLKVNGTAVADQTASFKTPANSINISDDYKLLLESNLTTPYLKSDGASNALITATIQDKEGKVMTDAKAEIEFTASRGNLANSRVAVQDGKAVNTLRSEFLSTEVAANITATVVESSVPELIGVSNRYQITMTPNPDAYATSIGAVITSAESNEADRVTAYFDRDVDVNNYLDANKNIDTTKALIDIKSGLNNSFTSGGNTVNAIGLVAVPGNPKAMEIIVDAPLVDNSNVSVRFRDRNGSQTSDNTVYFKLTDARQPALQKVDAEGYRTLKLEFSEAMIYETLADGNKQYAADYNKDAAGRDYDHFMLDGMPLLNETFGYGANAAEVSVGEFVKGEDNRNLVTITLGKNRNGERIYLKPGKHSIQVANVGDWASNTDTKNVLETQTFDFTVVENNTAPAIESVEIQSPEQYLVTFNAPVDKNVLYNAVDADIATNVKGNSIMQLREGSTDIGGVNGKNPIVVTAVSPSKDGVATQYIVEVTRDWTEVYGTRASRRNYYNYNYSLFIPANAIENANNGIRNTSDITYALTGAIKEPDEKSPEITAINPKAGTDYYVATMSEPVKVEASYHREGLTPSEEQGNDAGVPTPSAEFIKSDNSETIRAEILGFDDAFHKEIKIRPDNNSKTLPGGDWRLVVRTISDDVGNTAATLSKPFTAVTVVKEQNFKVVWAAVAVDGKKGNAVDGKAQFGEISDENENGRFIVVKFSQPVATFGNEANVMNQANYTINGRTLPQGTRIEAGIIGYDREAIEAGGYAESITIILPAGETVNAKNAVLNISDFVTSRNGERLTGDHEIKLPYNCFRNVNDTANDAVWGNDKDEKIGSKFGQAGYIEALKKALDDDSYRKIELDPACDFSAVDLEITRPVDIDLMDQTIRNLSYDFEDGALIKITNGRISGNLTINAPYADVEVSDMVINGVVLENVRPNTFKLLSGSIQKLTITDPDSITVQNSGTIVRVDVNTSGKVTLGGTTGATYAQVTVNKKATLSFTGDAVTTTVAVNTAVGAITITVEKPANIAKQVVGNGVTVTDEKGVKNEGLSSDKSASTADLQIAQTEAKKVLADRIEATSQGAINFLKDTTATSSSAIEILSVEVKDSTKAAVADYLTVTTLDSKESTSVSVIGQPTTSNVTEYIFVTCKVLGGERPNTTVTIEIPVTITRKTS